MKIGRICLTIELVKERVANSKPSFFSKSCKYIPNNPASARYLTVVYSIVKDSSADLGVNFKIFQNRPTVKAVCTKISKKICCIFVNIVIFLRENTEVSFFIF